MKVRVAIEDAAGTQYDAVHEQTTTFSLRKASITFDPPLPPIANGQTLRIYHEETGEELMWLDETFDGRLDAQA